MEVQNLLALYGLLNSEAMHFPVKNGKILQRYIIFILFMHVLHPFSTL